MYKLSFGTRVPGRYIAVGRSSGVAVKRGSTVVTSLKRMDSTFF